MAKANLKEQVQALISERVVEEYIRKRTLFPAVIIFDQRVGNEETVQYRCVSCGHTWTRKNQNMYGRSNQTIECPQCKMVMAPGRPIPEDGERRDYSFASWDGRKYESFQRMMYIEDAELNGSKGLALAEFSVIVTFYYSDRPERYTVELNRACYGFISNTQKIIFNSNGTRSSKMLGNAFDTHRTAVYASSDAVAQISKFKWMAGYVDFNSLGWLYKFDRYWKGMRTPSRKSLGEFQAEQTLAKYEIPDMPEVQIDGNVIFYREISQDMLTHEYSMEYYCKSCGTQYTGKKQIFYDSTVCPNCNLKVGNSVSIAKDSFSTEVAVMTMLDDKTLFIRAGTFVCKCDENWNLTYERPEKYRVFITLDPGNDPKVDFLVNEGYGENHIWVQKKNYVSDKFRFLISQLEYAECMDALKYTGFKECVESRLNKSDFGSCMSLEEVISYIRYQSMYPVVEQLCKRGFVSTLSKEIHHRVHNEQVTFIRLEEKKITDALSLPERLIKAYLKDHDEYSRLEKFKALYRIDENVREEDIEWILQYGVMESVIGEVVLESPMSIMRVCEYLEHVRINQCFQPKDAIVDWRDYLKAAKTINVDLTDNKARYPSSLKREHDRAVFKQKIILDEKKEEFFKAETEKYGRQYSCKSEEYMIIPPKDMKDLFEEGRKLNHCVGSYADRIIAGTSCIMFIRKADEPEKPYFTIEINQGGHFLVQLRANSNRMINHSTEKELVIFLREWAKKNNLSVS